MEQARADEAKPGTINKISTNSVNRKLGYVLSVSVIETMAVESTKPRCAK